MQTRNALLAAGATLTLFFPWCAGGCGGNFTDFAFQPFEFPFSRAGDIARIAAFGVPNWSGSEPHNGIDLIVAEQLTSTPIISPTAGTVSSITANENQFSNPPGQLLVTIAIRVNSEWTVNLVLEPSTVDAVLRAAQLAAIRVSEGQQIAAGGPVADLLVGTLGYPHLHYMVQRNGATVCPYAHSSETARTTFQNLAALPDSHLPDGSICYGLAGP